jgi:hypothetical protein
MKNRSPTGHAASQAGIARESRCGSGSSSVNTAKDSGTSGSFGSGGKHGELWRSLLCLTTLTVLACGSNAQPSASVTGTPTATATSTASAPNSSGTPVPANSGGTQGPMSNSDASTIANDVDASVAAGDGSATGTSSDSGQGPDVACNPADKKPDPTPVAFTMIVGYQSMTKPPTTGPDDAVIETDPGLPKWTLYHPKDLGTGDALHPILVWANGGCLEDGTLFGQWLLQAASYGFVALGDGIPTNPSADPGTNGFDTQSGAPQTKAMDWIIAENERPCSQYYHKLNVNKIAVSGQSCGGLMSLAAAGDKRVTTAIINNSGLLSPDMSIYSALHRPIAYFEGGSSDISYKNAETDYMNINNVPIFNANDPVGHAATWTDVNAGEFGRVNLGWLQWQLNGDMTAAKMFVGPDCQLCKSTTWTVKKKMIN